MQLLSAGCKGLHFTTPIVMGPMRGILCPDSGGETVCGLSGRAFKKSSCSGHKYYDDFCHKLNGATIESLWCWHVSLYFFLYMLKTFEQKKFFLAYARRRDVHWHFSLSTQAVLAASFSFYQKWLTVVFQKHSSVALHFLEAFFGDS